MSIANVAWHRTAMRNAVVCLVCLVVGCSSPQGAAPADPIGNANTVKQPSREAFVDDVVQALSAGDADRLVALVDWKGMLDRALQCDGPRNDLVDDEASLRKRAKESAAKAKGTQLTVVEIDSKSRSRRYGGSKAWNARLVMKGEPVGECIARTELVFHDVSVKVKMIRDGRARESRVKMQLLRADGKWFLAEIPRGPSGGAEGAMAKMEEFTMKMCACKEHDSKCAQDVTDEMTKWSQEMAKSAGDREPDEVTPEDAKKMADITKQMGECSMKAMTPAGP